MDIRNLYGQYENVEIGDLTGNEKKSMRETLYGILPEDLDGIEEHRMYVEILQKFRKAVSNDNELNGEGFTDMVKSLLAVGEDGIYSNGKRFIYELIQNVDDCEYEDSQDCHLDIQFKYNTEPGEIIFTYNEKGFTPKNVFAITGIAEKLKNISVDKVEIGEKGIGFKSVFGVADKVRIESGFFSFELYSENFTVPIPKYDDGFERVNGTRLTLEMPMDKVREEYDDMVNRYMKDEAVLNKNPILFLNKLTHLKMYFDNNRYIMFGVQRKEKEIIGSIEFENDIEISVEAKNRINGTDKSCKINIKCRRYTQPVIYGKRECQARYGKNAAFTERRHNITALFPTVTEDLRDYKGVMYSFLPTQIQMTVPMVLHVPFKLDGSREFVDPQGENEWFKFTIESLENFLKKIYVHLAKVVKQDIITYIPRKNDFFFDKTNEKIQCLLKDGLKGETICREKVFCTEGGDYESAENVESFASAENIENQEEIFNLLETGKKLFIPNCKRNMDWYNIHVIQDVPTLLFRKGMNDETKFPKIAEILDTIGRELKYAKLIEECCPMHLTPKQLLVISKHKFIYNGITDYCEQCIKKNEMPQISFAADISLMEEEFCTQIKDAVENYNLDAELKNYMKKIYYKLYGLEGIEGKFAIAGSNGIVIAKESSRGSLASLISKFDSKKVFTAVLNMRQASDQLDKADELMNDDDYLDLLVTVRNSVRESIGKDVYDKYIRIINQAGTDKGHFLNELLQNADDCEYIDGIEPAFDLSIKDNDNQHIVKVSYNEKGFTKQNVRAITAIGESTKKGLMSGNPIGEKGVGFKSVFGVAESVEIHSKGFNFVLTDRMPTVPKRCKALKDMSQSGTVLIFKMKDISQELKADEILRLCCCLRKLKKINVQGIKAHITDTETERSIIIEDKDGDKEYHFEKFIYDFEVSDPTAVEERSVNHPGISKEQRICCYIPKKYENEYPLYTGLPTKVDCRIPLIIDAPFELTTARDNIIQCRWNEWVREALHETIFKLMDEKKDTLGIKVFKYLKFGPQNHIDKFCNFSEPYLNEYNWTDKLKCSKILPVLGSEQFVAARDEKCLIVPRAVVFIGKKIDIASEFDGVIIDAYKEMKESTLLEQIGCCFSGVIENLNCISRALTEKKDMMLDKEFREALYGYLQDSDAQEGFSKNGLYERVKELPIFPIRTESGVEYVPYSRKIYTHQYEVSKGDFQILETKILPPEQAQAIAGYTERINELTQEVYEARYQKNLMEYIRSDKSPKEKAFYVLNEYKNNFEYFKSSRDALMGAIHEIPMEFASGDYLKGNTFTNKRELQIHGNIIKDLVVSEKFTELAEYLGCTDVFKIHYDDIDVEKSVSDEDIEDFENFDNYIEILRELISEEKISDEQIKKYNLQFLIGDHDKEDEDDDEDFPGQAVADLNNLKKKLHDKFKTEPNPYVEKQQTVREPKNRVDKEAYMNIMYASQNNPQKCFCH